MKLFYDIESQEIVTENQLFSEYTDAINAGIIDACTFDEYIKNSLTRYNGTLEFLEDV